MGTIFQKVTGDNCLVLDHREALIYPFDLGNDWKEIRAGGFFSASDTGLNGTPVNETVTPDSNSNNMYMGLVYNPNLDGLYLPLENGNNYVYMGVRQGTTPELKWSTFTNSYSFGDARPNNLNGLFLLATGSQYISTGFFNIPNSIAGSIIPLSSDPTMATSYAKYAGLKMVIDSSGTFVLSLFSSSYTYNVDTFTDTSIRALRKSLASPTAIITVGSGYYTHDFTSSGIPLPLPNSFFVYTPFFNNQLRIHNIVAERYN